MKDGIEGYLQDIISATRTVAILADKPSGSSLGGASCPVVGAVNRLSRLLAILLVVVCASTSLSQEVNPSQKSPWLTVKVAGEPTDSLRMIEYTVPDSGFIEMVIYGRIGGIFAVPVYAAQKAGNYTVVLKTADLPEGSYSIELRANHVWESIGRGGFRRCLPGTTPTWSREESDMLNQAIRLHGSDPARSKQLFDSLLTQYPGCINRGAVFYYALYVNCKLSDSTTFCSLVDSCVRRVPRSFVYHKIARDAHWLKRYYGLGLFYAKKAVATSADMPEPVRQRYLFGYYRTLGQLHEAVQQNEEATDAYQKALQAYLSLPPYDSQVENRDDIEIYRSLGLLMERQKDFGAALRFYEKGLLGSPHDEELWTSLQRAYSLKNVSDESFTSFRNELLSRIPKEEQPAPGALVGKAFPEFSLKTLEGATIRRSDLNGKVAVLNYWAYWCGICLEERPILEELYQEFKDSLVYVLGIHSDIGSNRHVDDDIVAVRKASARYPVSFPTVFRTGRGDRDAGIGIGTTPLTIVLDRKGVIRYVEEGFSKNATYKRLKESVEQLLRE